MDIVSMDEANGCVFVFAHYAQACRCKRDRIHIDK